LQNISKEATTIKDVAKKACVSISTVSRVLNTPESVREDKRKRVLKAIEELNYVPNPIARALGSNKIGTVAVVVPNIINNCAAEMVRGALEELEKHGFDLMLFTSNEDATREKNYLQQLKNKMVDGAIFIAGCTQELEYKELSSIMPIALIDRYENTTYVDVFTVDEQLGMNRLIEHLTELGHKDIGLLTGDIRTPAATSRIKKFKQTLNFYGLRLNKEFLVSSQWTMQGGYNAFMKLMTRKQTPTAVVASSDIVALGALSAAHEMKIRIPEDVSIVGFDNFPESRFSIPTLTTLKYPNYRLGQLAAKSILNRLNKSYSSGQRKILPLELLIRGSTGSCTTTK
jgi:DNA-binding LacI/PurR family transcriptional regulator